MGGVSVHPDPSELASIPAFAGLDSSQLASLATKFEVESFEAGHSPAKFGQHGYDFFVLVGGTARVEIDGEVVGHLEPGSVFGEMAFFAPDSLRSASVIPDTDIRVLSLFGTDFRTMQIEFPTVAKFIEDGYHDRQAHDEERARAHAAERPAE
jgi:CRP-like cAMP-binding protein